MRVDLKKIFELNYTLPAIVGHEIKRTPNCFVVKNVKIFVKFKIVNQLDLDITLSVGEWAIGSVVAVMAIWGVEGAEFSLIFVVGVELFDLK